jgi:type II secretory pathway pseudopilin PulG
MKKAKKPMSGVFTVISIAAVVLILVFVYQSQKANKLKETSLEKLSEVQKMLELDLENEYPETPRNVAKLHGDMTRLLYSGALDEEIKTLAIKIRALYDEEFLSNNAEEQYLTNLYSDIALWLKVNRKIENVFVVNEELEEINVQDGKEYATAFISFTITEKGKTSEIRNYLMRKDKDDKWKILGWEHMNDSQD